MNYRVYDTDRIARHSDRKGPPENIKMTEAKADLAKRRVVEDLNERSREIFRNIVEAYVETGEPIGSRTLAKCLNMNLSPASALPGTSVLCGSA